MNEKTRLKKESKKRMFPFIEENGKPFHAQKIGRNDLCPCKSGKKVKNCCKFETRKMKKTPFTEDEQKIMDHLVDAHALFINLKRQHPSEIKEWELSLHRLQDIVSVRILQREYPDTFIGI